MILTNDEFKSEVKYQIHKDKQHESAIHWMTGVVLFGFEKLQLNSYQFAFKYLCFIYLFVYLFINYNTIDIVYTSHVCMSSL